jgi:hypothetical protein
VPILNRGVGMIKRAVCALTLVALVGACGGGGDDDGDAAGTTPAPDTSTTVDDDGGDGGDDPTTTEAEDDADLPDFLGDFARVCTTQVGYDGAADYVAGPGVHPVILFEDYRGGDLVESSRTLPDGWSVEQDDDFEDNSELATAELLACSNRTEERPTGTMCDFENDDDTVTLELVDASYELVVYAAKTGEEVQRSTLEATSDGCPFIATFQEGDTAYVVEPEDDQYVNALKGVVAP